MSREIRALLVDDEPLVLSSLRRLLQREDFDVTIAASGPEALDLLESERYEVIVSDYKMPGMNGVEFLRRVAERWPDIHRVMLTAQADPQVLAESLEQGLLERSYGKPWDSRELVDGLRELVLARPRT
jgi:two-component system NtrC family sensor kinase